MPFVWDRFCVEYAIIDEDSYDPIRFVVVKRLHLKSNTKCSEALVRNVLSLSNFIEILK